VIIAILLFIIGITIFVKGADLLVDGTTSIAKCIGISTIVVGHTIVSFGTTFEEMHLSVYPIITDSSGYSYPIFFRC
jgi:cation:H+ antiporter